VPEVAIGNSCLDTRSLCLDTHRENLKTVASLFLWHLCFFGLLNFLLTSVSLVLST
jgi:hypothetical protein